jgi:hypothetical protein
MTGPAERACHQIPTPEGRAAKMMERMRAAALRRERRVRAGLDLAQGMRPDPSEHPNSIRRLEYQKDAGALRQELPPHSNRPATGD